MWIRSRGWAWGLAGMGVAMVGLAVAGTHSALPELLLGALGGSALVTGGWLLGRAGSPYRSGGIDGFRHNPLLDSLFEHSDSYIFFKDSQHRYLGATRPLAELVGQSRWQDVIGRTDSELYTAAIAEQHMAEDREIMASGQPIMDLPIGYWHPERGERWLVSRKFPLRDAAGDIVGVFGYSRDITEQRQTALALEARESEFVTLVEMMPGIVYRAAMDADWTMHFISDHVLQMTGYSPDQLVGNRELSFASLIHPDDRERVQDEVQAAVTVGCFFSVDYRLCHRDGREIWVLEQGQALRLANDGDAAIVLVGTILDVTERRQAAERLRRFLDAAPDAMVVTGRDGRVIIANQQTEQLFGYARVELEGAPATRLIPPRLRERYWGSVEGLRQRMREGGANPTLQVLGLTRSGRELPLEASFSTIEIDGQEMLACNLRDLSERQLMEARFRAVFNHARDAFILIDSQHRMTDGNPAVRSLFKAPAVEHFLAHFDHYSPQQQPDGRASVPAAHKMIRRALSGEPLQFEWLHRRADGVDFPCQVTLVPVEVAGQHMVLASVHDLSVHKQVESQLQRARDLAEETSLAKTEFLANMSHEIRTPLHAILGMSHLLAQADLHPRQRDYADSIELSARTLLAIVNEVLDFSKIEAGHMELEVAEFDLDAVLAQLSATSGSSARVKGLDFSIDLDDRVPRQLIGDSLRLGQILTNLVDNAVKFTEHGSVQVRAWLVERRDRDLTLAFSVTDTGIGISDEQRSRLFQPFTQADASTTRRYGGTGLGLTICKRLVGLMGGDIDLHSGPAGGSCFQFSVALQVADGTVQPLSIERYEGRPDPAELAAILPFLAGKRVLLVEDNPLSQRLAVELLRRLKLEVLTAETGREAVEKALAEPLDLVLMDVQMPEMDGLEATRLIRAEPRLIGLPIIAMTANALQRDRKACLEAGMNDFLGKPIEIPRLHQTLLRWLLHGAGDPQSAQHR